MLNHAIGKAFCPYPETCHHGPLLHQGQFAIMSLCGLCLQVQEMPLTNFTHLVHLAWNLTHLGLRLQLCDCSPFKEPRMIVNLAWTSTHLGLRLQLQLCDCARNARLSKKCLAWNSTHISLLLQLQLCDCVGFSCKSKKCLAWNPPWSPFAMQLCNCSPSKEPRMIVNIARTSTHLGLLLQLQLCDCIRTQRPLVKEVCWCTHRETKGVVRARIVADDDHHHHYYHHHCYHNCPFYCHHHHHPLSSKSP